MRATGTTFRHGGFLARVAGAARRTRRTTWPRRRSSASRRRRPSATPCSSRRRSAPCRRRCAACRASRSRPRVAPRSTTANRCCSRRSRGCSRPCRIYCSSGQPSSPFCSSSRSSACFRSQTPNAPSASRNTRPHRLPSAPVAAGIISTVGAFSNVWTARGIARSARPPRRLARLWSSEGRRRALLQPPRRDAAALSMREPLAGRLARSSAHGA